MTLVQGQLHVEVLPVQCLSDPPSMSHHSFENKVT